MFIQGVAHRDVSVPEDEVVNRLFGEKLSRVLHLVLAFVAEGEHLVGVRRPAGFGEVLGNGKRLPRMQHAVEYPVGTEVEDPLDESVAVLLSTQTVAVSDYTALAIDDKGLLLMKHLAVERLGEVVAYPHVVVSGEIIEVDPFLVQIVKGVKKSKMPFGYHVLVFKPEVEDVT